MSVAEEADRLAARVARIVALRRAACDLSAGRPALLVLFRRAFAGRGDASVSVCLERPVLRAPQPQGGRERAVERRTRAIWICFGSRWYSARSVQTT